ncbi:MAG: tRNA (adenosine(37)-N6)-threonylcarbamoyltransferase complex ATPase subunit type 1 TsaE [Neisseriaceae bacterium]|nr:tRNA (adenosine(37)-N6)-threonylcarbamoyltransferase complex ATPase subunit type 1 TsaE [Neisseriaceae bacterium]
MSLYSNIALLKTQCFLADGAATLRLASDFSPACLGGLILYLDGDLGAGKTTFTRGFLRGLGFLGKVKSPTYALLESYEIQGVFLHHFDLYRFVDELEWEDAGFRELLSPHAIILIEWPEKASGVLPRPDVRVSLSPEGAGRRLIFSAYTARGQQAVEQFLA